MNDNGYSKWKEKVHVQKRKRMQLLLKVIFPYFIVAAFIFVFGYDKPMFSKDKLIEFVPAFLFLFLFLIIILIICKKYKIPKYIPICNNCGKEIRNIKNDCKIGKIKYLSTVDKTAYQKVKSTIKGKTVYPRGGYSMRNSTLEYTSETNYEINQNIPLVKRYHVYEIEYICKNCNSVFCTYKEESLEPLETKEN